MPSKDDNPVQYQSISKCSELMGESQSKIFKKMDNLHTTQMTVLGEIKEQIAFQKGQDSVKFWKSFWAKILLIAVPGFLFLAVLGGVHWLKIKGWM